MMWQVAGPNKTWSSLFCPDDPIPVPWGGGVRAVYRNFRKFMPTTAVNDVHYCE